MPPRDKSQDEFEQLSKEPRVIESFEKTIQDVLGSPKNWVGPNLATHEQLIKLMQRAFQMGQQSTKGRTDWN